MTFLLIVGSVAVAHGLFWAIVLIGINHRASNRMLAVLLILLSLRTGKSVAGQLLPEYMYFFSSVGQTSMAAIGPALFHFILSVFNSEWKFRRRDALHYLPAFLLPAFTLATDWEYLNFTYRFFTLHVLAYVASTVIYLHRNRYLFMSDDLKWRWSWMIIASIFVLWITFVCQLYFYHPVVYNLIVVSAALIFYGLTWYAIPRSRLFIPEPSKRVTDVQLSQEIGKKIQVLIDEEIFTDSGLTVTSLASRIKYPAYAVSRALNHYFDKTFSELLTECRVKKAEQLLRSDREKLLTIEAIAYESGFSTLSAFYKAFKKQTGLTPNSYRSKHA